MMPSPLTSNARSAVVAPRTLRNRLRSAALTDPVAVGVAERRWRTLGPVRRHRRPDRPEPWSRSCATPSGLSQRAAGIAGKRNRRHRHAANDGGGDRLSGTAAPPFPRRECERPRVERHLGR